MCLQLGRDGFDAQLVQALTRDTNHVGELPNGNADRSVLVKGGFEALKTLCQQRDLLLSRAEVLGADGFSYNRAQRVDLTLIFLSPREESAAGDFEVVRDLRVGNPASAKLDELMDGVLVVHIRLRVEVRNWLPAG